ncbi:MAG: serine hydrolase domain-containing protein [Bacteroidota bacterium]
MTSCTAHTYKQGFSLWLICLISVTWVLGQNHLSGLTDSLTAYMDRNHIPAAMVSVVSSDTVLFSGGLGLANVEEGEPASAKHVFRLGSISKSFTALAMLSLLEEKRLPLSTPVKQIDPDLPIVNYWEAETPVTIAHLQEHTAGFDDFHLHALYNKVDLIVPPAIDMVHSHKNSYVCRWKPGTRKAYSNPGYVMLGHLIEKLSGRSYGEYIASAILKPLGMTSSGYYFSKPAQLPFAQGYRRTGNTLNPVPFTQIQGGPAGEFCSNAEDMSKYLQFVLHRDTSKLNTLKLPQNIYDRIEQPQTNIAAQQGLPYGYGLGVFSVWKNGYLFLGHDGGIDGFSSRYLYSREANLGVAVSINREGNATAMAQEILDFVLGEEPTPERDIVEIPESMAESLQGFYEYHSPRNQLLSFTDKMFAGISLDVQKDYVLTRSILGKARDTLRHAGDGLFYKNNEGVPSALMFDTEEGHPAWWMNESYWLQSSRTLRLVTFFGVLFSILGIVSFGAYGVISSLVRLIRGRKKYPLIHYLLLGACLSFGLLFLTFANVMGDLRHAGELDLNSGLFFISPFLMILFTLAALVNWRRILKGKLSRTIGYSLALLSCLVMVTYLWEIGFVGLKLWSY